MDIKELSVSDHFPYCMSPRRKVVSGFSLGLLVSLIVVSILLFNVFFKGPLLSPMLQGFNSSPLNDNSNNSVVHWPFSFKSTAAFSSTSSSSNRSKVNRSSASEEDMQNFGDSRQNVSGEGNVVDKTHEVNMPVVGKNGDVLGFNGEGVNMSKTHVGNFSEKVVEGRVKEETQLQNGSEINRHANFKNSEGEVAVLGTNHNGNFSVRVENGSLTNEEGRVKNGSAIDKKENSTKHDEKVVGLGTTHAGNFSEEVKKVKNGSFGGGDVVAGKNVSDVSLSTSVNNVTGDGHVGNLSNNTGNLGCPQKGENCSSPIENRRSSSGKKNTSAPSKDSQPVKRKRNSVGHCDIFDGRWVREETTPYYPMGSCPFIDKDFDCHRNGRPESEYLKWKWKPYGCDIPSFDATDFLERLRGKKLVFVGDSLNRNMWESLVCILHQSVHNKQRFHEISGRTEFKKKGFYSFRHEDYNCTVDFVNSPFLVRESSVNRKNGPLETLRLDLMDQTTSMYADADVVVFNTGHWWTHEKNNRGEDYYQEGNHVYPRLHVLKAYKKALKTWGRWVDKHVDSSRTQVIFRGFSEVHFSGGQWNSGGQCHKETEPILNDKFLDKYPSQMKVLEGIVRKMKTPVIYLNISRLTDYRKDGHPSIYRGQYDTVQEQIAAAQIQDCSHWCLPGVPDTWNQLLYASLLQTRKGSWRS